MNQAIFDCMHKSLGQQLTSRTKVFKVPLMIKEIFYHTTIIPTMSTTFNLKSSLFYKFLAWPCQEIKRIFCYFYDLFPSLIPVSFTLFSLLLISITFKVLNCSCDCLCLCWCWLMWASAVHNFSVTVATTTILRPRSIVQSAIENLVHVMSKIMGFIL